MWTPIDEQVPGTITYVEGLRCKLHEVFNVKEHNEKEEGGKKVKAKLSKPIKF